MSLSALWGRYRVPGDEPSKKCNVLLCGGGPHRSAIEAVTPDGGSNWIGSSILARAEENSSRSSEGRVLGPRIGWLQRTVRQRLSADSGTTGAFQRMLGARQVPDAFWTVRLADAASTVSMSSSH